MTTTPTPTVSPAPYSAAAPKAGAAGDLVGLIESALGIALPLRVRAWDGSEAGSTDNSPACAPPIVVILSPMALRHLVWRPGELGLARAYVSGALDVEGDLTEALRLVWSALRERADSTSSSRTPPLERVGKLAHLGVAGLRTAVRLGALGPPPARPASESRLTGRLHSRARDRAAISHHYDLSNDFYALLLGESMAYSSGFWTNDDEAYTLADAQRDKLDLVCRKLDLRPGSRLLDVGCGWGSLSLHAASEYGARVTAVTLASEQRDYVQARVAERGLTDRVDVRLSHYRDVVGDGFDAVATIEMGEHVGEAEYPGFTAALHRFLRPRGRLVVQQMSRAEKAPGGGAFIETYVAPDMHMKPLATTVGHLETAGFEIRDVQAMREHYPLTIRAWLATLEARWDDFVGLVGVETTRVWRLYLAGAALAFEQNRMGVDQILAVRPADDGTSGAPASPLAWLARDTGRFSA